MTEAGVERRLAAVLAADMVGYSRLMEADEAETHARLKALRGELIAPAVARHKGRIVKLTGDGVLAEFPSAVGAVLAAAEIQRAIASHEAARSADQRIALRIGINLGDVIIEDDDIYGDGVNIAARLEALAAPGGICVSRTVYNQVKSKVDVGFAPMGEHRVKNISEPVTVYRTLLDGARWRPLRRSPVRWRQGIVAATTVTVALVAVAAGVAWLRPWVPTLEAASVEDMAFPLPDKPSIAVLPFDNLSGDPKQEHLVDGLTENIITELSRFGDLFVIARNSVFTYKGRPVKVQQVAEELGVQYVLEGSMQRSGDRLRIIVQLIDALTGDHLWAERYDREFSDIFAVEDDVTQNIVVRLGGDHGEVAKAVRERARQRSAADFSAYEAFLLGMDHKHRFTKEDNTIAKKLFNKAIDLDPQFARGYVGLSMAQLMDYWHGWGDVPPAQSLEHAVAAARRALALDDTDAEAHWAMYLIHVVEKEYDQAVVELNRARSLSPNNADILVEAGWIKMILGKAEEGIGPIKAAMRLNPYHPDYYERLLAEVTYTARRYGEAIAALKVVKHHVPNSRLTFAASYAQLGQPEQARAQVAEALKLDPGVTTESTIDMLKDPADQEHWRDGLRKAGLMQKSPAPGT